MSIQDKYAVPNNSTHYNKYHRLLRQIGGRLRGLQLPHSGRKFPRDYIFYSQEKVHSIFRCKRCNTSSLKKSGKLMTNMQLKYQLLRMQQAYYVQSFYFLLSHTVAITVGILSRHSIDLFCYICHNAEFNSAT